MFTKWWMANLSPLRRGAKPILALFLCGALVAASGCSLLPREDEEEQLPVINPPKLSKKPEYTVQTKTLETKVQGAGRLMSLKEEELFFTEEGRRVKDVYVKSGDQVEQGQLIAELDMTDLESQLKQSRLQMKKDELQMIETLRKADEMSAEELEQAKIDFEMKREKLADDEAKLGRARLTAPFAGTVVGVYMKKGDTAQAYDTVAVVADLSQLTVAADIGPDDLEKVAVGMEAVVSINALGQFKGKVEQLPNPKNDGNQQGGGNGSGGRQQDSIDNYLIVALDSMPEGAARGTPLSVSITVDKKENAVVIPRAALRTYAGRNYVQVADPDGTKREVDVEIGQQTATDVEIKNGLTPGQKVVGL